jgi:APA family basic amino acid/polyamine antiporter
VIFSAFVFYALAAFAVVVLRRTMPDAPRPYRAWGYPVVPALYIAFALFIEWALLTHKALRSVTGLCIVALGIPVYYLWRRRTEARDSQP